jgi:uncharacterized protein YoxC
MRSRSRSRGDQRPANDLSQARLLQTHPSMENWHIVLVVLVAVLVGSLIPVLLQLRSTLHQVERSLRTTGKRVDQTLDEAHAVAERINRLLGGLDGGEKQLAGLLTSARQLAQTLDRVRSTVNVASAVGAAIAPAVVAMVRSFGDERQAQTVERDEDRDSRGNGQERDEVHLRAREERDYGYELGQRRG